jgi:hypothetical protein
MTDLSSKNEIPHYPVTVWEGILIVMGAIALVAAGMVGLGIKVLNNAFDPVRAEAIAKSLMDYKIPGGSQGVFGINIGSAKLAWVRSTTNPPDVILFTGKTPITKEGGQRSQEELRRDFAIPPTEDTSQEFMITESSSENRLFCGQVVPVTVEKGDQFLGELSAPIPAVRYVISTTEGAAERLVILTATGKNADEKAEVVFNSLKCR